MENNKELEKALNVFEQWLLENFALADDQVMINKHKDLFIEMYNKYEEDIINEGEIDVEDIVKELTEKEKQLLKDTINYGFWDDTVEDFLNDNGKIEYVGCIGYCIDEAENAGRFKKNTIHRMFRSIYKKLCLADNHQIGKVISQNENWFGDNSGAMIFIRDEYAIPFEEWAKK